MRTQQTQMIPHQRKIRIRESGVREAVSLHSRQRGHSKVVVWLALFLLLASAIPAISTAAPTKWPKLLSPEVTTKVERNEPVEVLVLLDDADERVMEAAATPNQGQLHRASASEYNQRMQKRKSLMDALKDRVKVEVADSDLELKTDYPVLPILHVRVTSVQALDKLIQHQKVLSIDENRANRPFLAQSLPLIGRTNTQIAAYNGAAATVAVLDTGVDYSRTEFGGCAAPGGTCKVVYAQDFAPSDGKFDDNGHGTNVAAIVLGVAPAAKIAALDVFRTDGYAYTSDIINAINWCVTNKASYSIASINMSLGGGRYYSPVAPTDSWGTAIQSAVDAGILVAAAAGNDTYTNSLGTPAAYANVVSVGAVYDSNLGGMNWSVCSDSSTFADKITCFSDSAPFLTVLAPGSIITAAGISMSGTSQATPHVAGAAAVLRAAYPADSVSQTVTRLKQGKSITDSRNGVVTPRVDLVAALGTPGNSSGYTLVTSVTPVGTGSVSPATGVFAPGTSVTLTAAANAGYAFTGWSGACSGTASTCTILMDSDKTAAASFTASVTPLTNGVAVSNLSDTLDNLKHFYIDVPSGIGSLTIKTYGGTGDVDLFTRRDSLPTTTTYDCRPNLYGNSETCTYTNPIAGRYYATLYAYANYSGVNLLASYVAAKKIQMSAINYSISEGGGQISIPVYRQGGATGTVSVHYATANGTALAGSDYTGKSGTLSWASGDVATKYIVVPIKNDTIKESNETFTVRLSAVTGAVLGANKTATITIIDND